MATLSSRPTYTSSQITTFFKHISLPQAAPTTNSSKNLNLLTQIQQHTLANVTFNNLSLHYSPHHTVSIDPAHLFHKIVERGHGGYCMENNCFFGTILRSLGFEVYSAGARVSEEVNGTGKGYGGWSHMVNIVTIDNKQYMVDIGFGNNGPTQPLLLEDRHEEASIEPSRHRLIYEHIASTSSKAANQKLWILQHRNSPAPEDDWKAIYAFTELEFLPQDYEVMNYWTSHSRTTFFTYRIIVVKCLMDEGGSGDLVGTVIMTEGLVKRRVKGKSDVLRECKTEGERVEALEEFFGIRLREEERRGIKDLMTELKGAYGGG